MTMNWDDIETVLACLALYASGWTTGSIIREFVLPERVDIHLGPFRYIRNRDVSEMRIGPVVRKRVGTATKIHIERKTA